jgi:hypothetical protein
MAWSETLGQVMQTRPILAYGASYLGGAYLETIRRAGFAEDHRLRPGPAAVSHLSRGNRDHARGVSGSGQGHRHRRGDYGCLPAGAGGLAGANDPAAA